MKVWTRRSLLTCQRAGPLLWKPDWQAAHHVTPEPAIAPGGNPQEPPREPNSVWSVPLYRGKPVLEGGRGRAWGLPDRPVPLGKTGPGAQLAGPQSACQDVWLLLPRSSTATPHQFWSMDGSHVPTGSVPMTENPGRGRGLEPRGHHAQPPRRRLAGLRLPRAPSTSLPRTGVWAECTAGWRPPP